jgi:hypothetical protein
MMKKTVVILSVIFLLIVNNASADLVENLESGTIDSAKAKQYLIKKN